MSCISYIINISVAGKYISSSQATLRVATPFDRRNHILRLLEIYFIIKNIEILIHW